MRTDSSDGLWGVLLGGCVSWLLFSLAGVPAERSSQPRWLVKERDQVEWLAFDGDLRAVSENPTDRKGVDSYGTDEHDEYDLDERDADERGVDGARIAGNGPLGDCLTGPGGGPTLHPGKGGMVIHWANGAHASAPFPKALAMARSPSGSLLIAGVSGRLALRRGSPSRGVVALGTVPGEVQALAFGPRQGTWWVLLSLPVAESLDGVAGASGALALLAETRAADELEVNVLWLQATGIDGPALLAAVPRRALAWVVGESPGRSTGRARLIGEGGAHASPAEGNVTEVELPLDAPVQALATDRGELLVAFPGALMLWDELGVARSCRGGFDELVQLRRTPKRSP